MADVESGRAAKKPRFERIKGIAPIKLEFRVERPLRAGPGFANEAAPAYDDEKAEEAGLDRAGGSAQPGPGRKGKHGGNPKKQRGQNKQRNLVQQKEAVRFCEKEKDAQGQCPYGAGCRFEHDVAKYIASKPADIGGVCPVFAAVGFCPAGIKCRWLASHFDPATNTVVVDEARRAEAAKTNYEVHRVLPDVQHSLQRKLFDMGRSARYLKWVEDQEGAAPAAAAPAAAAENEENERTDAAADAPADAAPAAPAAEAPAAATAPADARRDDYAAFAEGVLRPTEKRRLDYRGAKVLSPLTTVGNLPYRRLMKTLGADVTFSEMALSLPLIQGSKSEWALPRAHASELPNFAVQIAASKPWHAVKAAQVVADLAPRTGELNLNCGCPIDLLFRQGAGSALLDNPSKIIRMVRGMNAVSGEIPVTIKIRTGTKDGHPTAKNLVRRLVADEQVGCITLHGRSRAQRYTREADWAYIREIADLVKAERADRALQPWIVGNGDVYSWEDWYEHVEQQGVDTCMVARGALIKPWIFEEIESRQYLDKSASERLEYLRQYANYGLEHWGADDYGVNQTRRFLCEWMSFTHRYVPVGLLEYLPPKLNDRPPPFAGRDELETLLASPNHLDWIKVSEMFLGPAPASFEFEPKHKSNSYAPAVAAAAADAAAAAGAAAPAAAA